MADDIVTRLRQVMSFDRGLIPVVDPLAAEAVNEIERLRHQVDRFDTALDDIAHLTDDLQVHHRIKEARRV